MGRFCYIQRHFFSFFGKPRVFCCWLQLLLNVQILKVSVRKCWRFTLWYYQILIAYGHDQPEEGKALLGAAACFRLWSDASLEVTFCSLMNHLLSERWVTAECWQCSISYGHKAGSVQSGRGWNSRLITCSHPKGIWQSKRVHFNVTDVCNPRAWLCSRPVAAKPLYLTQFWLLHPLASFLVYQMCYPLRQFGRQVFRWKLSEMLFWFHMLFNSFWWIPQFSVTFQTRKYDILYAT